MAKKTSYLTELIERHERWKADGGDRAEEQDRDPDFDLSVQFFVAEHAPNDISRQGNSDPEDLWDFGTVRHVGGPSTVGRSQSNVPAQDDRLTWSGTRRSNMSSNTSANTSSTLTATPAPKRGSTDATLTSSIAAKGDLPPVPVQTPKKHDNEATVKNSLPNGAPDGKPRSTIQREPSDEYEDYDDDFRGPDGVPPISEELPDTTILDSVVLPALASVSDLYLNRILFNRDSAALPSRVDTGGPCGSEHTSTRLYRSGTNHTRSHDGIGQRNC
jgi:serine/threonine-protein kinase 24/25/MST4